MKASLFFINGKIQNTIAKLCSNPKDRILDIGSGTYPVYREHIKGSIINFDVQRHNTVHVIGTADKLPFKKRTFDKILLINSLYYTEDPKAVLEQSHDLLKENGTLILITPFIYPIHDAPLDKYRFTKFGIKALCKQYSKVKIMELGGIFNLPAIFLHSLLKGISLALSKNKAASYIAYILMFPLLVLGQLISLLDVIDRTGRWPTYYLTMAKK